MIIALFGGDGRALGTYAAVLVARAAASVGTATTLLRVVGPDESRLPSLGKVPDTFRLVELCDDRSSLHENLCRETMDVPGTDLTVLDLPGAWLASSPVDLRVDAKVIPVGPSVLECSIAACALRGAPAAQPPWLLACGPTSAGQFARNMRDAMVARGLPGTAARLIGRCLPGPNHARADRSDPNPDALSIRAAIRVLEVVAPGTVEEHESEAGLLAPSMFVTGETDRRTAQERLRDLAHALDAVDDREYPPSDELDAAPVLEDWELGVRPVVALLGCVDGHPGFTTGRRVRTSEVYASDRRTWARTYSRLYRLGRPAGSRPTLQ